MTNTNDIVERLRRIFNESGFKHCKEAADLIEQLRKSNTDIRKSRKAGWGRIAELEEECKRWRKSSRSNFIYPLEDKE